MSEVPGNPEEEMVKNFNVVVLAPEGLGYGKGPISQKERAEANPGLANTVEAAIMDSPKLLTDVAIDPKTGQPVDDDGCGDGRPVLRIFEGEIERNKSWNRAKDFGGGATMMTGALIGMAKTRGKSLVESFKAGMQHLTKHKIGFGAHTDDHAHGDNCGCGAIDKAPQVLENVVTYEDKIRGSLAALGVTNTDAVDEVIGNYKQYHEETKGQSYSGKEVAEGIMNSGKVVKELTGDHKEMYVILNMVEGKTVNQEYIREISGDKAQVFAVDVWRLRSIANRAFPDDPKMTDAERAEATANREKAFIGELVYTLGVAATLTKGDLPVYVVQPKTSA